MKKAVFYLLKPLDSTSLTYFPFSSNVALDVIIVNNKVIAKGGMMSLINFAGWLGASKIPVICESIEDIS